jgi:hypothetical protein
VDPEGVDGRLGEATASPVAGDGVADWQGYRSWIERSADAAYAEFGLYQAAADRYQRLHERLGLALIVLSAVISGSLLESIGGSARDWQPVATAALSVVATVVAGVQGLIKPAERSAAFDKAAREYYAASGQAMAILFELTFTQDAKVVTNAMRRKLLELEGQHREVGVRAPRLPTRPSRRPRSADGER